MVNYVHNFVFLSNNLKRFDLTKVNEKIYILSLLPTYQFYNPTCTLSICKLLS